MNKCPITVILIGYLLPLLQIFQQNVKAKWKAEVTTFSKHSEYCSSVDGTTQITGRCSGPVLLSLYTKYNTLKL